MILEILFWASLAMLSLTYFAYPLIAALVGYLYDSRSDLDSIGASSEDMPPVSCLVPAYNESSVIENKIKNFATFNYPADAIEIIVGDDGSDDDTRDRVESHANDRIRLLPTKPRSGKASILNRMVDEARHDLLMITDANVIVDPDALRLLVDRMSDPSVAAVTGEVTLVDSGAEIQGGESAYYWMERRIQVAESSIGSVMGVDGGLYLIRREQFRTLPADTLLDDLVVSMNIIRDGGRVIYDDRAKAIETGTPSARQEFFRRIRIAAGAAQLLRRGQFPRLRQPVLLFQFVAHKLLRWISPLLFLTTMITSASLAEAGTMYFCAFIAQVVFWIGTLFVVFSKHLRSNHFGSVLFYFALSQAGMLCGLLKGLFNRQSVRWDKASRPADETSLSRESK